MSDIEVILDDTNSLIQYPSGSWVPSNVDVDGASNSVTCAESPGSVSVTYNFHTVDVWAYYSPGSPIPQVSCTIDGKSLQVFDPPDTSSNPDIWWQWYVCQAQGLPTQNHTVEVTVTEATQTQEFCLDKFDVMTPQFASLLESNSTSAPSSTSSPNAVVTSKAKTGAIVGFTLGGIVLTVAICGALFLCYRRRKQHQYARMSGDDDDFERSSIHSRRKSTLMSFSLPRWSRRKQRKEPTWVEVRHPVSIVPPLVEKSSFPHLDDTTSRPDAVRADSFDFPSEDRTVSPQELGLPDLLESEKPEDSGEHTDTATTPEQAQLVSPPITPQSAESSATPSPGHFISPPAGSVTK